MAASLLVLGSAADATQYAAVSTDTAVLRTDAVVFATVNRFDPVVGQDGVYTVTLENESMVVGRWTSPVVSFQVRGEINARNDALRINRDLPPFAKGGRYLFFFQGGAYRSAPIVQFTLPIYAVRGTGEAVLCPGGEIYGLGLQGLECSTQDQQAAPPLSEAEVSRLLQGAWRNARERSPEAAGRYDRDASPRTVGVSR